MTRTFRLLALSLAALLGTATLASAELGERLTLNILPDDPIGPGDPFSFELSDGRLGDLAFILVGLEAGTFPFGEVSLDIDPLFGFTLGRFNDSGSFALESIASPTWSSSWTGTPVPCCPGSCRTPWRQASA